MKNMEWADLNGRTMKHCDVRLDAGSRAFRYGDGLFETICIRKGKMPFLEDHFARLLAGMDLLGISRSPGFEDDLETAVSHLFRKNGQPFFGAMRLQVWRGGGGRYLPESDEPGWFIELYASDADPWNYEQPARLLADREQQLSLHKASGIKSCNALPYILAAKAAAAAGFDDAILFNGNKMAEATASNLFFIRRDQLITAPLSSGIVAGIMREQVLKAAKAINLSLKEEALTLSELANPDACFLSNAIRGVRPVKAIGDLIFQDKSPVTDEIRDIIRRII